MVWTIEAKVLPLAGLFGHMYLEAFKDDGQRVFQINGIATCRHTKRTKAIGSSNDVLKAYMGEKFTLANTADATRENHPHKGVIIFQGSEKETTILLQKIINKAQDINSKDIPYNITKCNSNSIFASFTKLIDDESGLINKRELKKLTSFPTIVPGIKNSNLSWVNREAFTKITNKSNSIGKSGGKK